MFVWQCILMWLSLLAAGVLSVVGFGIWCDRHQVFPGRRFLGAFRRLPWPVQFFLIAFSLHMIVHGSIKTNAVGEVEGAAQQRGRDILVACNEAVSTFFSRDRNVASPLGGEGRGARRAPYEIPQPEAACVPANAELTQNWWRRGCWEDWRTVTFEDGWVFPHGSNHFSRVVVMSQGEILASVCDAHPVASLGARVAHVPFDTCFYHEHTPSNSYRFVWDRAYIERNANMPMTAAVELFRNGDTCVTTNGVSTVMPYEIPFPHDGIGQDDDWVRANFTNATDILSVGYANWVDAQVGVDLTNGIYKFTASFPDDPPEATELIVGDLSVCVTNAGEYVFVLEKGVEYDFGTSPYDASVEYSMQDDLMPDPVFANRWWGDDNGVWTVDGDWQWISIPTIWGFGYCMWLPKFHGSPDVAHLGVDDFPMTFEAVLSDCCRTNGVTYHWSTSTEGVRILSPNSRVTQVDVDGLPSWERFSLTVDAYLANETLTSTLVTTYGTNATPQVVADIGCQSVMFVNDDHRSQRFYWVGVKISCEVETNGHFKVAHDGDAGAMFYSDRGTNRIELLEHDFSLNESTEYGFYVACTNCGSGRFSVECTTADGELVATTNSYRVIEPVCPLVCNEIEYTPEGSFVNPCCLVCGEQSRIRVGVARGIFSPSEVQWTVQGASTVRTNGWDLLVTPSAPGEVLGVCASFNDDEEQPLLAMPVVSKRRIPIRGFIVSHPDEVEVDVDVLDVMVMWANTVYKQVGIEFFVTNVVSDVGTTNLWELTYTKWIETANGRKQVLSDDALGLLNTYDKGDCIEVYLVGGVHEAERPSCGWGAIAFWTPKGVIVGRDCSTALAHELGHALGLSDCYGSVGNVNLPGLNEPVSSSFFVDKTLDYYDGASGRGFYSADETKDVILKRLLMYGVSDGGGSDIPAGNVRAFPDVESQSPAPASIGVGYSSIYRSNEEVYSR